ncbi:MAG: hypothetical protein WCZ89_08375 [Phycisphaerae bacterium]
MLLTKQVLENYGACNEGMLWYISNDEPDSVEETIEKLLASDECEKFGWSNWLLSHVLPNDDKIRYAIFAAELVIDIFEKEFPEDKRPRNAIEAARVYLSNKDATAYDAVRAAAGAAYAAYVAVREAYDVAYVAARAAARAAYDVAYVAVRAAYDVAYVAAREAYVADAALAAAYVDCVAADGAREAYVATYTKIINYGLSLLKLKSKT